MINSKQHEQVAIVMEDASEDKYDQDQLDILDQDDDDMEDEIDKPSEDISDNRKILDHLDHEIKEEIAGSYLSYLW